MKNHTRITGVSGIALAALCLMAQVQDPLATTRATLTGPTEREWVFKQIQVFMGPGNRCEQGEALRFLADRTVVIESCVNKQMTERRVPWTLRPNGVLDPILTFDDAEYELVFSDKDGKHSMRLRKRGASKVDPASDKVYRLAEQ